MPFAVSDVVTRRLVLTADELAAERGFTMGPQRKREAVEANQRLSHLIASMERHFGHPIGLAVW